ncbi:fluoride efflux transporter FluC [Microbacterium sp. NPDC007973]|uniref:fluoride efflux transporter FluC n=1 Tax=Microbacterium sp. NPDC007973 TaxID=3364182 RepID=UPI0036F0C80A
MSLWRDAVLVAVGGAIGTAVRAGLTLGLGDDLGSALVPIINVVGAFAIGILFGWRARMPESSRAQRVQLFIGTGVLGGFTTYSALAVESADLALLWWGVATVIVGTAAAWGGVLLGRGGRAR